LAHGILPTVSTALDPLTPPINAVELLRPQQRVGQDIHRGLESQGYVMSGIIHDVHSRAVSMAMLVLLAMATPIKTQVYTLPSKPNSSARALYPSSNGTGSPVAGRT